MLFRTLIALSILRECSSQSSGLFVSTQQGQVQGSNPVPSVRQFLGIPYAIANRWEAPQTPPSYSNILQALEFGDSCPQAFVPSNVEFLKLVHAGNFTVPESEDCLSVNIWSPDLSRKQNTSVMIWVYGGGLSFGSSNEPEYNGLNFVRDHEDITIVTFNYRLNVFGQPNAPQLANETVSQNFGLLDVNAAIDWVHKNIAQFGGDPDRIIIAGESAGAAAVDVYAFQRPNDAIVKGKAFQAHLPRIIQESGSLSGRSAITDTIGPMIFPESWSQLAGILGCGTDATSGQLSCMQTVPSKTMEDAVIKANLAFNLAVDDITNFHDTRARAEAGNFLSVPLLHGTNANEADVLIVGAEIDSKGFVTPGLTEAVSDLQTAVDFTCPAAIVSADRMQANVTVYRYQFQGVFPELTGRNDLRSFHFSEVPFVFNTIPNPTAEMKALSKTVQDAWVAFARDPVKGLNDLGWPEYDPKTNSLAQLGSFDNSTGYTLGSGGLLDSICANSTILNTALTQLSALLF